MTTSDDDLARSLLGKGFVDPEAFVAPPSPGAGEGLPGKPFGKYRVLRKLGEGGSSRVYLALDPLLRRRVALKVLKDASPEDVDRFAREARLTAELSHPHIVRVHEVGRVGRKPYLAMDWIDGRPVEPSEPLGAVRTLLPIARALEAAHRRGMIHRDVKPGNILVDSAGKAWLADFGMARHVVAGRGESLTCSGTFLGTPAFMSPEQARGETRRLTAATDVFSLGSTLYFLATGRLPYDGQSPLEVVRNVVETLPLPLRQVAPRAPRALEEIVARAMAPDPADRYPTAAPMADDLERLLQGMPPAVARRRWTWPAAAAAAAVLLGAWIFFDRPPAARETVVQPSPAPPAVAPLPAPRPVAAAAPASVPRPAPPVPARRVVDAPLREKILREVLEAPAALRRPFLGDAEARRAVELLAAGAVGEEDDRFLREQVADATAKGLEAERRFLVEEQARLDTRTSERPDLLVVRDGRAYTGRVLDEPAYGVVFLHAGEPRFFAKEDVRSLTRDATREAHFARRVAAAVSEGTSDLAGWARSAEAEGLPAWRDALLFRLLARDPADVALRAALGFPPHGPLQAASRPTPQAPTIAYEGEAYTPEELERTLRERSFVVVNGAWCRLQDWRWAPEEPWSGQVLAVASRDVGPRTWEDVRLEAAYDVAQLKLVEVRRAVPRFRYVGPSTASGGRAVIEVQAPGPLVECGVTAAAAVVEGRGGSARVFVVTSVGTSRPLYAIEAGREEGRHDVSDAVRGQDRFSIVADLAGDGAVFLPGTVQPPLVVEGKVAVRHEALTRLLPPR